MISLKLLLALNDYDSAETTSSIANELQSGIIEVARTDGDLIESLTLTDEGTARLPTPLPRLPDATA
jgi:hypothetical protein